MPDDTFVCSACTEVPFPAGMASIPRSESPAAFSIFARLQVLFYLQIVGSKIIENRKTGVTLLCKHGSGAQARGHVGKRNSGTVPYGRSSLHKFRKCNGAPAVPCFTCFLGRQIWNVLIVPPLAIVKRVFTAAENTWQGVRRAKALELRNSWYKGN